MESDRGWTDSRDPSQLASREARAVGRSGSRRGALSAQLLGAQSLGEPHNHCAVRLERPSLGGRFAVGKQTLGSMIDDPLYVAVDLLCFSRVAFPGLSWGELLNREEESDDEGMDQCCDRGSGRRVVPRS